MLLDVLSGMETIKVAVGYKVNGQLVEFFPTESSTLSQVEVVYEEFPGWNDDITLATRQDQLPAAALNYLRRLQQILDCPIKVVSVGPERDQTIAINL